MKNIFVFVAMIISAVILSGCGTTQLSPEAENQSSPEKKAQDLVVEKEIARTARFEISTEGTKRVFTQAMYHDQSPDVYLEARNPQLVQVKKADISWDDFFKTLPFSLTKNCLITGTKQTFCSTESKKLRFFLNSVETPDALDLEIQQDDVLRVEYR